LIREVNTNVIDPTPSTPVKIEHPGHSGLGIATFVIGIMACLGQLVPVIGLAVSFLALKYHSSQQMQTALDISGFSSLSSCVSPALAVFGIGFGIASLVQHGSSKKLGVIGLILNGAVFILLILSSLLLPVIARLLCKCPG
jgi:hypothetical protein